MGKLGHCLTQQSCQAALAAAGPPTARLPAHQEGPHGPGVCQDRGEIAEALCLELVQRAARVWNFCRKLMNATDNAYQEAFLPKIVPIL